MNRQEIESQIDFTVDEEQLIAEFMEAQKHTLLAATLHPEQVVNKRIHFSCEDLPSKPNSLTFAFVMEKFNLMRMVGQLLQESPEELPDTLEEVLFGISSSVLQMIYKCNPGEDLTSVAIINEIACEHVVKAIGHEYKELLEMARN
jgi:hypothetical protein